jgi:hypothetical protein
MEIQPDQDPKLVETDGGRLPEEQENWNETSYKAINEMRAETGALFPGFAQGASGNPTLVLGGFSLILMPMQGMNDVFQNILSLLQKLPSATQLLSG